MFHVMWSHKCRSNLLHEYVNWAVDFTLVPIAKQDEVILQKRKCNNIYHQNMLQERQQEQQKDTEEYLEVLCDEMQFVLLSTNVLSSCREELPSHLALFLTAQAVVIVTGLRKQ